MRDMHADLWDSDRLDLFGNKMEGNRFLVLLNIFILLGVADQQNLNIREIFSSSPDFIRASIY